MKKQLFEYYNKLSNIYNELYLEEQLEKYKESKDMIDFSKEDVVLDAGCGNGEITKLIQKQVKMIVGVDLSIEMLKKADITYKALADIESLPFKNNTFDKAVSFTVIQDLKNPQKAINELKRISSLKLVTFLAKRLKPSMFKIKIIKQKKGKKDYLIIFK